LLDETLERDYRALVESAPDSPLSHTLAWRDLLRERGMGTPVYWLAYRDGALRGALPAFVFHGERGAVLNSLPFIQSTGGIVTPAGCSDEERHSLVAALAGAMLRWCKDHDLLAASLVGSPFGGQADEQAFPVAPDFQFRRTVRALDLSRPLAFRQSVRQAIQSAEKLNPVLHEAGSLEEARLVHDIYAGNMRHIGVTPLDWDFYQRLYTLAAKPRWARFVWAEGDGEPVSALVMLWHGGIIDYYSVGSTERGRQAQINSWICARQIDAARQAGMRWWNWMVSPSPQVYDFKKRWGGEDRQYSIWTWKFRGCSSLLEMSPAELSQVFPGYYVVPYAWLKNA